MSAKSKAKGAQLEKAVAFIQKTLLKHDPSLKGAKFSVETNKLFSIEGCRYEADVFVVIAEGSPYESKCIFECKNWRKRVGRKEITDFSDKVNVIGATRGFLVAREITKDALAKLQQDKRLIYVPCNDSFVSPLSFRLIHIDFEILPLTIHMKQRGVEQRSSPETLDAKGKICLLKSEPIVFEDLVLNQVNKLVTDTFNESDRSAYEGTHWIECGQETIFSPKEFTIDSVEFENMRVWVRCFATVRQRKIMSKFELSEQGRFISFEPIESVVDGKQIEVNLVQLI